MLGDNWCPRVGDNWRPGNSELTGVSLDEFEDIDGHDPMDGCAPELV